MNIEKVKEALEDCAELYVLADGIQSFEDFEGGQPSLGTLKNLQIIKESAIKAKSALAELEKPAEPVSDDDVIPCVVSHCDYFDIQCLANCCRGEREPVYYLCVNYLKNSKMIKDYAASCHTKKCADSWINAKDQLPEKGIDVLCFSRADDRLFVGTFTHYANKEKTWCDDECFGLTVDFWQPLPEPPHV